jgi:hypothetical protein
VLTLEQHEGFLALLWSWNALVRLAPINLKNPTLPYIKTKFMNLIVATLPFDFCMGWPNVSSVWAIS